MADKREVELLIVSEAGGERTERRVRADRYDKAGDVYLRYPEDESQLGQTTTTVKISGDRLRIVRHGDVRSEQSFIPSQRLRGYYETAQGTLELFTETKQLRIKLQEQPASVTWRYDLYVGGDYAGRYKLTLTMFDI